MNIGYIYGFDAYPPQGGNATHAYELVQWFRRRGHAIHTIGDRATPGLERYSSDDTGIETFVRQIDILYIRVDGWYFNRSPIKKRCMEGATVPIVWEINAPCNERLAFLDLKRTNNAGRGFLIHADSFIRKLHRLKLASRIAYDEMVRRKYARKVEEAICVSEALERYARESLGIVRTHVVPNGADPDLFHPGHDRFDFAPKYRNHFKVLWAGSPLVPWHCLDVLQQVVKRVGEVTQEILFVVLANQITDQIPRGENVLVCEKINHGDVPRYIVAADVCLALHPEYTWSKWGFHGSTIKLFEYMGCGKVVIASRLGQIRSVVDDGRDGLLTDNSTDDVVQKILYLFEHKQEIQEMGRLARRKIVDYYNWERVADATLDIFARLCADRAVSHV